MTRNARQSPEDSLQKIKPDGNRGKFRENLQNSETINSETSKLQPVNLSETSGDTVGVPQRVADSLQNF